jgi:lipopolysaccharide/colanic/teichoic acid biosynthesis glycosyltransferase
MKRHELLFSVLKVPFDFVLIFSSFFIARALREINDFVPWVNLPIQTIESKFLLNFAIVWSLLYVLIFTIHWLYNIKITSSKIKETLDIIGYSIYSFLFLSVIIYFWKWVFYKIEIPRLVILFTLIVWIFLVILERIFLNKLQNILLNKWILEKRKIILINNKSDKEIENILQDIKKANIYDLTWYINKTEIKKSKIKFLGNDINKINDLWEIADEIIYIDSDFSSEELYKIWDYSRIFWIKYRYVTNWFDVTKTNTTISLLNEIPLIEIKTTPLDSWARVIKRLLDFFWSIFWMIIFSPIFLLIAILIKIEDPSGPAIYKNKRVWQNWKEFNLYKFRYIKWKYCVKDSYWVNPEEDEALKYEQKLIKERSTRHWPLYKIKDDPRKTRTWRFIEKYSLDELPQLFNVFIWNMSLVWPRPHQPREVDNYQIHQRRVLTIKPWITGLAQVNWREKNKFEDEINLDIFYIENRNFLLDIKIILKTFTTIINRK